MTVRFLRTRDAQVNAQDALSFPMYLDLKATSRAFSEVAFYSDASLAVGTGADARSAAGSKVTASFFKLLGVRPYFGRFFTADEAGEPTSANVAVVSYAYWQRELHGDTQVLGRRLPIGSTQFTIIGVAPRGFTGIGLNAVDVWIPLTAGVTPAEYSSWTTSRNGYWLLGMVRLASGVSREAASAAATQRLRNSLRQEGMSDERIATQRPGIGLVSVLPSEAQAGNPRARVAVLLAAVSFIVLVIACANVANLQLARGMGRRREIAVRIALGVSRGRLVAQLLTESVVLAIAGGVASILVAWWGSSFVRRVLLGSSDLAGDWPIDLRVLAYTFAASIGVGLLSGLAPASQLGRTTITAELKEGPREGGSHRSRARTVLLVAQTALSILLLVGTGLFVLSLQRIEGLHLGLEPRRALVASIQTSGTSYTDAEQALLYQRLLETAKRDPGMESAALATTLPFYSSWAVRVRVPGRDSLPRVADGGPYLDEVSPEYFQTVGMRILRGRSFTNADQASAPRVAIINESLARLWWPNESALGKCMKIGGDTMPCSEIVGISENSRRESVIEDVTVQYFVPLAQAIARPSISYVLLARPRSDAAAAAEPFRRALHRALPNLPYVHVYPLEDLVSPQKRSFRLGALMFAAFGGLALVLAAVGLYSVLAYDVATRTRELGVRVAIGADAWQVMQLVFAGGLRVAAFGAVGGLIVALAAGRLVEPLLFQTSPHDPLILAGAVAVVLVVSLLAAFLPARRALLVDPIIALKAE
jgi:putative ABC transport system permease protein